MSILAKHTSKCSECNEYMVAGRDRIRLLYDGGTVWVHVTCYTKFWDDVTNQMTLDPQEEADLKNDDIWLREKGLID